MVGEIRVAVVDDNSMFVEILLEVLGRIENVVVKGFTNSEQALYEVTRDKYDIIVTDNAMPKIDGLLLAEKVKSVYNPHMILVSVIADKLGAELFDYKLRKPLDFNLLFEAINDLVYRINEKKKIAVDYIINELLLDIEVAGKEKILLEQTLRSLLYDYDSPIDGSIYNKLSDKMHKDPRTIRRNITKVIDKKYEEKPSLFKRFLGLDHKPKNAEFINKMLEKICEKFNEER